MYKEMDSTRMYTGDRFGYAHSVCLATDGNRVYVYGSPLPPQNGCVPGMAACEQPITKVSPTVSPLKPLPSTRRIFGNRLLWQRQSQIGWKWIRATPL